MLASGSVPPRQPSEPAVLVAELLKGRVNSHQAPKFALLMMLLFQMSRAIDNEFLFIQFVEDKHRENKVLIRISLKLWQ